jgi:hypothetical protein
MVYTQYSHLAAVPRHLLRDVPVKAGDIIGLVGDTGVKSARGRLHFALSIRPSSQFAEVFWDPEPLMSRWPLRVPLHGTVAGLASLSGPAERPAGEQNQRKPTHARSRKKAAAPEPSSADADSATD